MITTRLTQVVLEEIEGHHTNTRLSQALLEVILPSGLTPAPAVVTARLSQALVEIITPRPPQYVANHTLVYDIATDRWQSDTRGFGAFLDEGGAGNLLGARGAAVLQLESGQLDFDVLGNSAPIPLKLLTGFHHMAAPENPKVFADIVIDICTNGAALTVGTALNDRSDTMTAIGSVYTAPGALREQFVFALGDDDLGITGRSLAVQLQGNAPQAASVIVYGIGIHYYVEPRASQTWDTGLSDWGSPLVKQIDLIELDVQAPAGMKLELFSNLQDSTSCVLPPTAGHTLLEVPVSKFGVDPLRPDAFEGRLLRVAATTDPDTVGADDSFTAPFQLWGARARYREIGVYVDGRNGEEWLTFPDDLGEIALVKLARIVELDCETTDSTTLRMFTDLPGDALAQRVEHIWPACSRRTVRFRVPGWTKGKLWQFQFLPAGILRLYRMRVYAKAMSSEENWNWYVVQLPETNLMQQWKEFPIAA